MKNPLAQPSTCKTRCGQVALSHLPGIRFGQTAVRNEAKEQAPKMPSTHAPADMGDQYFIIGDASASRQPDAEDGKPSSRAAFVVSDFSIMCQNRSGRSRSTIKKTVHKS